jgi:hypothetical protein
VRKLFFSFNSCGNYFPSCTCEPKYQYAADLDGEADDVDFEDYGIFSGYWQDFCPDGWQLK